MSESLKPAQKQLSSFIGSGLISAFSLRSDANMSLSCGDTKDSLQNRKKFLRELGIDYRSLTSVKQVHAAGIHHVTEKEKGRGALSDDNALPDTDALITKEKNLPLAVFSADCLSVFLYDPNTPAIGLVHAGWRSSKEGIIQKTISLMRKYFNTDTGFLRVGFGPSIRNCCYGVGEEFKDLFSFGLVTRGSRHYLDLAGINKKQALAAGVKEINIYDSGLCTYCRNNEFFSFRKEGKACGRIMSVMMLVA